MKKQLLSLFAIAILFIGCGGVNAPSVQEKVSKRPSMLYQPGSYERMKMKYPLKVGILKLNDKRVFPFYTSDGFFREKDISGLEQLTYLELKRSGLFEKVISINETAPFEITDDFLQKMNQKYNVDMIFVFDVTNFNLFRTKQGSSMTASSFVDNNKEYAQGAFTMELLSSMVGQLIYYDGGYVVWSGEVKRANKIPVSTGDLTSKQLSLLAKNALKPMFDELKKHIATTGKRMAQ